MCKKKLLPFRVPWVSIHSSHSDFWSSPLPAGSSFACSVSSLGLYLDDYPPGRRHLRDSAPADCRLGEGKSSTCSLCASHFLHNGKKLMMPSNLTVANIFYDFRIYSKLWGRDSSYMFGFGSLNAVARCFPLLHFISLYFICCCFLSFHFLRIFGSLLSSLLFLGAFFFFCCFLLLSSVAFCFPFLTVFSGCPQPRCLFTFFTYIL